MYSIEGLRLLLGADGSRAATFAQVSRMTVDVVADVYIYAELRASSWIAVPPLVIVAAGEHDILDMNSSSIMGSRSRGRAHAEQGARRAISVIAAALPSGCGRPRRDLHAASACAAPGADTHGLACARGQSLVSSEFQSSTF